MARPDHRLKQGAARTTAGFVIAPDHPALAGHFPGHPVVPGVVLLDHAIALIGAALAQPLEIFQLGSVKFLEPCVARRTGDGHARSRCARHDPLHAQRQRPGR
ncbi:hypothetical protein ACU4GD_10865 [Cupriavidus basilensis]